MGLENNLKRPGLPLLFLTLSALGATMAATIGRVSAAPIATSTIGAVPTLIGWGGLRMDESVAGTAGTMSAVFPTEFASDMELLLIQLKSMGYNTVRVDFDPYCTDTVDYNYMSVYSQTNAQRAVEIAQHYGFWIILDYHGYSDVFRNTSCWLSYWKPIVQNIGPLYANIIWEPENEPTLDCANSPSSCPVAPCSTDPSCVLSLSSAYQQWVSQTRLLGDTHWIVVQNLCSFACGLSDMSQGYPTVTDPLGTLSQGGRVFISLHSYMDYGQYTSSWTNTTADNVAQQFYQAVLGGVSSTGWPALNTEGGTDPLCNSSSGPCTPDMILPGSADYTVVTLHFIQKLVDLYDTNTPQRINWVWWPAGSWTNTPGAGVYGATQCNSNPIGWGCILAFVPLIPPVSTPDFTITASPPAPTNVGSSPGSTITIALINGLTGPVVLTDTIPSGLNCGPFSSTSFVANGTATISCSSGSPLTYSLTITGTMGSLSHSTKLMFVFRDFTLSANPSTLTVTVGAQGTSVISLNTLNGFNSAVSLSVAAPAGDLASLTTNTISGSGLSTLTTSQSSVGSYAVVISGTSGSLTRTTTITVQVEPSNILPTITVPGPQNATVGKTLSFTVLGNDPTGTGGTVILSVTGLTPNMSFDPITGTFIFTPTKDQAGQTYNVSFTATDSNNQSWSKTQSVPIHVQTAAGQPSGGGSCFSCFLPVGLTTTAWLFAVGAVIGIVSSISMLSIRFHHRTRNRALERVGA